jgi:hypothetical protein
MKMTMSPSGVVNYYLNDVLVHTSTKTASGTYYVETAIYDVNHSTTSSITTPSTNTIISATSLTDNTSTPHHYAFTRDGNSWSIYQDGVYKATATDSTSLGSISGTTPFTGQIPSTWNSNTNVAFTISGDTITGTSTTWNGNQAKTNESITNGEQFDFKILGTVGASYVSIDKTTTVDTGNTADIGV